MSKPQAALQAILSEHPNHPKIKQTLKLMCESRQKLTYHGMVSSNQTYLQVKGLIASDYDQFNYIHKMMHSRIVGVMGKIKRQQIKVKDRQNEWRQIKLQKQREENQVDQAIVAEVEQVLNNIDLPISLFKRNDKYWYPENPKTIEAKDYVHERIKKDKERKLAIKKLEKKNREKRQKQEQQQMNQHMKMTQARKQEIKMHLESKLSAINQAKQERSRTISESQRYGSSLKPLFKKIQQEQNQHRHSALEEHKRRLSQLRKLHQSVDMDELKQRKNKLDEMKKNKQPVQIFDEPIKVYKSKYYTSMTSRSRVSEYDTSKSMYDKKKEYGEIVRKQFKPDVDPDLVAEMEERLKVMNRKRVKKNPKPKEKKQSGDEDEDSDEENNQSKVKTVSAPVHQLDDSLDEDDSEQDGRPPKRIRNQDQDPDHAQRYEMGVQYLEYVRNLPKKRENKTTSKFPEQLEEEEKRSRYEQTNAGHTKFYKDYLRQFSKTKRNTIDHIDISRIQKKSNYSIIGRDYHDLQNQTRVVEQKAKNQEQLMKYKKMKNQQALQKRAQIDTAMIEAIKARLSMMG